MFYYVESFVCVIRESFVCVIMESFCRCYCVF